MFIAFISATILLLLTFIFFSDALYFALSRFLGHKEEKDLRQLFALTRGLGPIIASWLLYNLFLLFPHNPIWFYAVSLCVIFALLALWGKSAWTSLSANYLWLARIVKDLISVSRTRKILVALILSILLFSLLIAVAYPLVANDSLAYAMDARIMTRDRSLENYLAVQLADEATGYLYPSFQTPFLQMLYVWLDMLSNSSPADLLARFVSPYYAFQTLLLLGYIISRERGKDAALWGVFALAAVPIFVVESYHNTIDPPRFYIGLLAAIWLADFIKRKPDKLLRHAVVSGALFGLSLFTHSLNLVVVFVGLLFLFFAFRKPAAMLIQMLLLVGGTTFFFGASYHYLLNMPVLSKAAKTTSAIALPLSSLVESESAPVIALTQLYSSITNITIYGTFFFFLLAALFHWLGMPRKTINQKIALAVVGSYVFLIFGGLFSWSAGNVRYLGSVLPFGAVLIGPFVQSAINRINKQAQRRFVIALAIATLSLPLFGVVAFRGAKVENNYSGPDYQPFRSVFTIETVLSDPSESFRRLWNEYLGINKTFRYLFADQQTKLFQSNDIFAAVQYLNENTGPDALTLVWRAPHFFYYAEARGIVRTDPALERFWRFRTGISIYEKLAEAGVDYLLLDASVNPADDLVGGLTEFLSNPAFCPVVYRYSSAAVCKLAPQPPENRFQ